MELDRPGQPDIPQHGRGIGVKVRSVQMRWEPNGPGVTAGHLVTVVVMSDELVCRSRRRRRAFGKESRFLLIPWSLMSNLPGAMLNVQAVLLDMDGTLVDSDAAVERSWRAWAAEYRVDPGRGPLVAHGLPALGNVRRLRPDLSEDEAAAAARYQLELEYVDVADITAAPGAPELLAELDRLGLPWAVVDQRRSPAGPDPAGRGRDQARAAGHHRRRAGRASPTPRVTCWPRASSASIRAGAWWWRTPRPGSGPGGGRRRGRGAQRRPGRYPARRPVRADVAAGSGREPEGVGDRVSRETVARRQRRAARGAADARPPRLTGYALAHVFGRCCRMSAHVIIP